MKPRVAIASLLLLLASIALSRHPLQVSDPSIGPPNVECKPAAPLRIEVVEQVVHSGRLRVEYEVTPLIDASRLVVTPRLPVEGEVRVVRGLDREDVSAGSTLRGVLERRGSIDAPFGIIATIDFVRPDFVRPGFVRPGFVRPGLVRPGLVRPDGIERATRTYWFREPTPGDPDLPRVEGSVATLEVPAIRVGGVR